MQFNNPYDNKLEEHLAATMFGGTFGEGWAGLRCPRSVFWAYMLAHALVWVMLTLFVAAIASTFDAENVIIVSSTVTHTMFVIGWLGIRRGSGGFTGWRILPDIVVILVELIFAMPLATLVFEAHKALTEKEEKTA